MQPGSYGGNAADPGTVTVVTGTDHLNTVQEELVEGMEEEEYKNGGYGYEKTFLVFSGAGCVARLNRAGNKAEHLAAGKEESQ